MARPFLQGRIFSEVTGPNALGFEKILSENYNPIVRKIRNIPKPVVCAVNGTAAGAGANIALCCDIVVASQSASFIQAFSKIGLIPDCGGTFFLPRLIGWQKASALAMLGDKVSAEEAERMGMIYKVYPDIELLETSMQIAAKLAMMPTLGLGYTKKALNASMINGLEDQLREEDILQQIAAQTSDYIEGVHAFIEKRQPRFTGE